MRSPASSTSPRAPSKPTWPASCASSAPETASSSPCGPTRPDASDTAKAPPPFAAPPQRHVALRPARPASPSTSRRRPPGKDSSRTGVPEVLPVPAKTTQTRRSRGHRCSRGPRLFANWIPAFRQDPGVEVLRQHSNNYGAVQRVARLSRHLADQPAPDAARPPQHAYRPTKLSQRLSNETVAKILAAYAAGATTREVGARFGL